MNASQATPQVLIALPEHKIAEFTNKLLTQIPQAKAYSFPVIKLKEKSFELTLQDLQAFNYLILSSSFGTQTFFQHLSKSHSQAEIQSAFANVNIASVGPSVNEVLQQYGLKASIQGKGNNIASLETALIGGLKLFNTTIENTFLVKEDNKEDALNLSKSHLFITGEKTMTLEFIERLKAKGANCKRLIVYDSLAVQNPDWLSLNQFTQNESQLKFICLSSPEGVKTFSNLLLAQKYELPQNAQSISLGPATQKKAKELFPQLSHLDCKSIYSYKAMIQIIKQQLL